MKKSEEINTEAVNDASPRQNLRVITGGKDGGGGDWLSGIETGTYFLARPRKNWRYRDWETPLCWGL